MCYIGVNKSGSGNVEQWNTIIYLHFTAVFTIKQSVFIWPAETSERESKIVMILFL